MSDIKVTSSQPPKAVSNVQIGNETYTKMSVVTTTFGCLKPLRSILNKHKRKRRDLVKRPRQFFCLRDTEENFFSVFKGYFCYLFFPLFEVNQLAFLQKGHRFVAGGGFLSFYIV